MSDSCLPSGDFLAPQPDFDWGPERRATQQRLIRRLGRLIRMLALVVVTCAASAAVATLCWIALAPG